MGNLRLHMMFKNQPGSVLGEIALIGTLKMLTRYLKLVLLCAAQLDERIQDS